jgi:hypothetical protein
LYYFNFAAEHVRCLLIIAVLVFCFFKPAFGASLEVDRHLHLGNWSPFASYWEGGSAVCAWTKSDDAGFRITAQNHNNANKFQLTNDIGDGVSITLSWEHIDHPYAGEQLKPGTPSSQTYFFNPNYGCGVSPNYMMRLRVDKADLDNAMPGIYRGALVLTLSPI